MTHAEFRGEIVKMWCNSQERREEFTELLSAFDKLPDVAAEIENYINYLISDLDTCCESCALTIFDKLRNKLKELSK